MLLHLLYPFQTFKLNKQTGRVGPLIGSFYSSKILLCLSDWRRCASWLTTSVLQDYKSFTNCLIRMDNAMSQVHLLNEYVVGVAQMDRQAAWLCCKHGMENRLCPG
jgi:hypothetical protein